MCFRPVQFHSFLIYYATRFQCFCNGHILYTTLLMGDTHHMGQSSYFSIIHTYMPMSTPCNDTTTINSRLVVVFSNCSIRHASFISFLSLIFRVGVCVCVPTFHIIPNISLIALALAIHCITFWPPGPLRPGGLFRSSPSKAYPPSSSAPSGVSKSVAERIDNRC